VNLRRLAIGTTVAAAVAAGSAGAIAAAGRDDGRKAEQSVLEDAAKRLNVSPEDLRSALGAAEDAQLDRAVKEGRITRAQADELQARRRDSGRVLGLGHRGPGGRGPGRPGGFPHHGPGRVLGAAADALGISERRLLAQLRDGRSLADVARARGKELGDVKAAITAAVRDDLEAAVKAGRLTDAERDRMQQELDEHVDELARRSFRGPRGEHHHHHHPDGPGPGGPFLP
jgi:hypothetical protein